MEVLPRQKLCDIVKKYGWPIADNPGRLEAILREKCFGYDREINAIIAAVKDNAVFDLISAGEGVSLKLLIEILIERIKNNSNLTESEARWAVESWIMALGKNETREIKKAQTAKKSAKAAEDIKILIPKSYIEKWIIYFVLIAVFIFTLLIGIYLLNQSVKSSNEADIYIVNLKMEQINLLHFYSTSLF